MSQYLLQTVVSWSSCCGFMVRALRSMMIIIISAVLSIYHSIGHHSATIHIQVTQPGDTVNAEQTALLDCSEAVVDSCGWR